MLRVIRKYIISPLVPDIYIFEINKTIKMQLVMYFQVLLIVFFRILKTEIEPLNEIS